MFLILVILSPFIFKYASFKVYILNSLFNISSFFSKIYFSSVVVANNLIVFKNIEIGLYSAIAIFIIGKMIDIVFEGINFCKIVYIISDKYNKITEELNYSLKKGATEIYGRGSYSSNDKMIIICVTKRKDINQIKATSKKIDPNSFIIITDAREVYGLGFK